MYMNSDENSQWITTYGIYTNNKPSKSTDIMWTVWNGSCIVIFLSYYTIAFQQCSAKIAFFPAAWNEQN